MGNGETPAFLLGLAQPCSPNRATFPRTSARLSPCPSPFSFYREDRGVVTVPASGAGVHSGLEGEVTGRAVLRKHGLGI